MKKLLPLILLLWAGITQASTISFKDGVENAFSDGKPYAGTKDTFVDSSQPSYAYGGSAVVKFNNARFAGLLSFDLSSFYEPVQAVANARLRLAVRGQPSWAGRAYTVSVYRIHTSNAGWQDGATDNKEATQGETAWSFKNRGAGGEADVLWSSGVGFSAQDYSTAAVASYEYTFTDSSSPEFIEIPLPASMIMEWINDPSANAGLAFQINGSAQFAIFSSKNRNGTQPELIFDFSTAPDLEPITLVGGLSDTEEGNLLANGSFERFAPGGVPDSWTWMGSAINDSGRSNARVWAGSYALKITDNSSSASVGLLSAPIEVEEGAGYTLSGLVYREQSTMQASVYVRYYDANMVQLYNKSTTAGGDVGAWNRLSEVHRAPQRAKYARLICYSSSTSTGVAWFDAIAFSRSGDNLIPASGTFEDQLGHHPSGWLRWDCLSARSVVEADPLNPSNRVLRLVDNFPTAASAYYTSVAVTPNMSYEAEADFLQEAGAAPFLQIKYFDRNGVEIPYSGGIASPSPSDTWQRLSLATRAPEGAVRAALIVRTSIPGTGVSSVDNVVFRQMHEVRYVAPAARGTRDGNSAQNAAKYNHKPFWNSVNSALASSSVKVVFLEGKYITNHSEDALFLQYIGSDQHVLTLEGQHPFGSVFTRTAAATQDLQQQVTLRNVKNIVVRHLHWEEDAPTRSIRTGYSLAIQAPAGTNSPTRNVTVESCSFIGLWRNYYGAFGTHHDSSNVTLRRSEFVGGGLTAHFHMVYNSYGPQHLYMLDNYFQDGRGAYMRNRANTSYVLIKNNRFVSTHKDYNQFFVEQAVFNDVNPGDETLGHTFLYTGNSFNYLVNGGDNIAYSVWADGYDPHVDGISWNYLLTSAEGQIMRSSNDAQRKAIMRNNFGLDFDTDIIFEDNTRIGRHAQNARLYVGSCCGASNRGGNGTYNISSLIGD